MMLRNRTLNALLDDGQPYKRERSHRKPNSGDDRMYVAVAAIREQIAKAFEGAGKVSTRLRIN